MVTSRRARLTIEPLQMVRLRLAVEKAVSENTVGNEVNANESL